MAFVDHHQIVLIDGRRLGRVGGEQDALHQALNGADVHLRFGLGRHVLQPLQAEDVGEGLAGHDLGGRELARRLIAERGAVDDEADAAESLGGEQAIEQRDGELGLAGAGRHREQHRAADLSPAPPRPPDRVAAGSGEAESRTRMAAP